MEDTKTKSLADEVNDLIAAAHDYNAAYTWPPAARAFAEGHRPQPTRKGWRVFYQYRQAHRPKLDPRAIDIAVAQQVELFAANNEPASVITEFAQLAGIERGRVSRNLVEIPTGPAPRLSPG